MPGTFPGRGDKRGSGWGAVRSSLLRGCSGQKAPGSLPGAIPASHAHSCRSQRPIPAESFLRPQGECCIFFNPSVAAASWKMVGMPFGEDPGMSGSDWHVFRGLPVPHSEACPRLLSTRLWQQPGRLLGLPSLANPFPQSPLLADGLMLLTFVMHRPPPPAVRPVGPQGISLISGPLLKQRAPPQA